MKTLISLTGGLVIMMTLPNDDGGAKELPLGHPRLYLTSGDLPGLRKLRSQGVHRRLWKNLKVSADWCLTQTPRREWIAPVSPDPVYENLYDRFYAIMGDLAITEHLAFAYAFSGDKRYGEAARQWTLASCRAWKREAEGEPDGSKAYAVSRLLKGVAVGYDVAHDCFTGAEQQEVRDTLAAICRKYYTGYFSAPTIAGPDFHTHHAIVEWSSFGVAALALLNEAPEASAWLDASVRKFEEHLLPTGLAPDGAQIEGATFWASTMHYRLFFMDALRRVTGRDLFRPYQKFMSADLALASVATEKRFSGWPGGYSQNHESVVLEPSYGQLDYYAPVLLHLAREYRRPTCQYLALWDRSLGCIQRTRYITPHGEPLLFEFGGYAYLWYDVTVPAEPDEQRLAYHFPSVDEAYLRCSWKPNDLLVGVRKGEVVVHAGGTPVLVDPADWRDPPTSLRVRALEDKGEVATIRCGGDKGEVLTVELHRSEGRLVLRRQVPEDWQWWCQGSPLRAGNGVSWGRRVRARVVAGELTSWEPEGYAPVLSTAYGKLTMADPAPMRFPRATIRPPANGEIVLEVQARLP